MSSRISQSGWWVARSASLDGCRTCWLADGSTASFACEPVVLTTQTADVGSMRLAAKLGFGEVEHFRVRDLSSGSVSGPRHAVRFSVQQ